LKVFEDVIRQTATFVLKFQAQVQWQERSGADYTQ